MASPAISWSPSTAPCAGAGTGAIRAPSCSTCQRVAGCASGAPAAATAPWPSCAPCWASPTKAKGGKALRCPVLQPSNSPFPTPKILPRTQKIEGYFAGRGISPKTLSAYGVGADGSGNIFFPFTLKGQLVYGKYRSPQPASGPKEWQTPGAMPILFGMDNCRPDAPLVITEGLIDALSLAEAGIPNAVSVPSGCNNLNWVEHCWTWLEQFTDIVLFGDNDPPGQQMVEELIRRLGEYRCRKVCEYPLTPQGKPCKDANEILTCLDAVTLGEMVASAQAVPTKGLLDLSTVSPIDPTAIPRIKTNIPMLDECLAGWPRARSPCSPARRARARDHRGAIAAGGHPAGV